MQVTAWIVTGLVALLSIQPTLNMLSPGQVMNTSYDPFDLVNTYGAFGSVGQARYNVIFEGTMDPQPSDQAAWKPYIYKGLPVTPNQMPPQVAPYQLRLDWQMWFAAMSTPDQYPWTYHLIWKLLHNDPGAVSLFAANPFPKQPPRYIRAVLYRFKFAKPGNAQRLWWTREKIGPWIPANSVNDPALVGFLRQVGWVK